MTDSPDSPPSSTPETPPAHVGNLQAAAARSCALDPTDPASLALVAASGLAPNGDGEMCLPFRRSHIERSRPEVTDD